DRPSIPLDLAQAGMTSNCRDLVRSAPCLGEAARSRLAEAMRAAMMKVRHIAPATKPIRESDARERLPKFCHQKRHIPGDPPPLKWSDLRYVFDIQEDCNGKEAIQA